MTKWFWREPAPSVYPGVPHNFIPAFFNTEAEAVKACPVGFTVVKGFVV